jgi:hypothetical protein
MKTGKTILLKIFLFIVIGNTYAFSQIEVCSCASYSSLRFKTDYEDIFPHELIKSEKIKQAIIYTTGHSSIDSSQQLFSRYIELKLNFDNNGYVLSRIDYWHGFPHQIYEFERNTSGQIIKQTQTFLDSLEQKTDYVASKIIDYTYDKKNRLVLEKNRDYTGKVVKGEKTNYKKYEYTTDDKLLRKTRHSYDRYDHTYSSDTFSYTYSNDNLSCVTSTGTSLKNAFIIDTLTYNKAGKLLLKRTFYSENTFGTYEESYTYSIEGKLLTYNTKMDARGGSECPGGGNYTDHYFYTSDGFVERITNSFGIYTCEMKFEYLK